MPIPSSSSLSPVATTSSPQTTTESTSPRPLPFHSRYFPRGMASYDPHYDNPPKPVEAVSTPPAALHAEEFVGDSYGSLGLSKKKNVANGGGNKFANGVADVLSKGNSSSFGRTIMELLVHFVFLFIVSWITLSTSSSMTYYFTNIMSEAFVTAKAPSQKTFNDIGTLDDLWEYIENQFVEGLYSNAPHPNGEGNSTEEAMVLFENRLLGHPRVRQVKVRNDSCVVVDAFSREIKECFSPYSSGGEDRASFSPNSTSSTAAFVYSTASELENKDFGGTLSTYGGGGFVQELSMTDKDSAMEDLVFLKNNRWINRGTRLVIIDFALYNANLNLFCVVKLVLEIPATGGVVPMAQLNSMKLIRYVSVKDYVTLAMEGIFVLFIVIFIIQEVVDIFRCRLRYFVDFWNWIDLVVIILSIVSIVLSLRRTSLSKSRINKLLEGSLTSAPFDDVINAENAYTSVSAIVAFFAWIKVFKYISFNKTLSQLSATLSRSSKDIGGFAMMFFVFFFAYAQFGYLVFGTQIADYSTFYDAIFALFRTILGDFDFHALERANRILGPVFFITYVFFVFFVLLNMFLAIINDTYVEVKGESALHPRDFRIAEAVATMFYKLKRAFGCARDSSSIDSSLNFQAWRHELKKNGYSEAAIRDKFAKYDVMEWKEMDEEVAERLEEELKEERRERQIAAARYKEIFLVGQRVEQLESAIASMALRAEEVAAKLGQAEIEKVRTEDHDNRVTAQGMIPRDGEL